MGDGASLRHGLCAATHWVMQTLDIVGVCHGLRRAHAAGFVAPVCAGRWAARTLAVAGDVHKVLKLIE